MVGEASKNDKDDDPRADTNSSYYLHACKWHPYLWKPRGLVAGDEEFIVCKEQNWFCGWNNQYNRRRLTRIHEVDALWCYDQRINHYRHGENNQINCQIRKYFCINMDWLGRKIWESRLSLQCNKMESPYHPIIPTYMVSGKRFTPYLQPQGVHMASAYVI